MTRSRKLAVLLAAVSALTALTVPAAATGLPATSTAAVYPDHGVAGSTFTAAGGGCVHSGATVLASLIADNGWDIVSGGTTPAPGGEWSVDLTTPGSTRPGTYDVSASCSGYDGYSGNLVEVYDVGSYTVDFPATIPTETGSLTIDKSAVRPGDTVKVEGEAEARDTVNVALYSSPVRLTDVAVPTTLDPVSGVAKFSTTVTIPADTAHGAHTLVAMNTEGYGKPVVLTATITVGDTTVPAAAPGATGTLASTGADGTKPMVLTGLALMVIGAAGVLAAERLRRARVEA